MVSSVTFIAAMDNPYHALLNSYPKLTNLNIFTATPTHTITHFIEAKDDPGFSHLYHLSSKKLKVIYVEFNHILQLSTIHPFFNRPWLLSWLMVLKRSRDW